MGLQQFFLIVLSVVITGVMIAGGVLLFTARVKVANRNAIIQDMYNIASLAISFYKTPQNQGGGGNEWNVDTFKIYCGYPLSNNGRFFLTENGRIQVSEISRNRLRVKGWGTEIGFDNNRAIRARLFLSGTDPDNMSFKILN